MRYLNFILLLYCVFVFGQDPTLPTIELLDLKAGPAINGFGKNTTGGRGGAVIHVTNLNDSGSGSFREALTTSGTRTIVFDVGGTINAANYFSIDPGFGNVTIAGQTAPGGGILIKGGELRISTSNVIVEHIRFRLGPSPSGAASNEDGINITAYSGNNIGNIVIDHCSISWGKDENMSLVGGFSGSTISNVTISNNVVAESGYGILSYKGNSNISIIGNVLAFNNERNIRANWPVSGAFQFEQINNILYGYRGGNNVSFGVKFTSLNNEFKKAPSVSFGGTASVQAESDGTGTTGNTYAYIAGNIAASGQSEYSTNFNPYIEASPFASSNYTPMPASDLAGFLLPHVGASLPSRDAVDSRVLNYYINSNGSAAESGTWPTITTGSRSASYDTDGDGMPDAFEDAFGLNKNSASDRNNTKLSWTFPGVANVTNTANFTNLEIFRRQNDFQLMVDGYVTDDDSWDITPAGEDPGPEIPFDYNINNSQRTKNRLIRAGF